MKHIKIILGLVLFASVTTFAQSPRIKLNQITKDTVKGSVLISSPTDSGMVYSRDFYIAYGADTVLILYGDTLAATSGIISSVLSDGVTITGDGTSGNELKVDTATVISTIQGLVDTLTNYVTIAGTETITGAKTFSTDLNVDAKIALNDGDDNIVIGDGAGASLVSGQGIRNVLIGTESGRLINSGDDNVANGYRVLYNDTSGSHNIGVGSYALYLNESGSYNIANGGLSLYANETGNGNIANGFYALHNNLSGSYNIANAYESLYFNTSGNYNIGSGFRALYSLNSGSDNQAYGYQAGRYLSDGSTALTTANGSLFLGSNTRASANGNSNEIVIGIDAIGNGSNSVTLGNTSTTKTILNGNVGIGTSTPSFNLTAGNGNGGAAIYIYGNLVSGSALRLGPSASSILQHYGEGFDPNAVNEVIAIGSGDPNTYLVFNSGGTEKIRVLINGNVGIGTSEPDYKLDVVGDINASGEVRNSGVILTSDARYKKDITPLYNANDKLMLFNPVSYYWNDLMLQRMEESKSKTKTSIKYGLVAQEVEAIMPEFVSEGEDGYKAIDYQAIITLLIKSNQEQQTEIDQLKTLITDLTNRLIILENK